MPNRLREIRLAKRWSLQVLADKTGKAFQTIAQYESGERPIPASFLQKAAEVLGVSAEKIIEAPARAGALRDAHGIPDLSWMLADYSEMELIDKLNRVLRDTDVPLDERCRRGQIYFDELKRRPDEAAEAAVGLLPGTSSKQVSDAARASLAMVEELPGVHPAQPPKPGAAGPSAGKHGRARDAGGASGSRPASPGPAQDEPEPGE